MMPLLALLAFGGDGGWLVGSHQKRPETRSFGRSVVTSPNKLLHKQLKHIDVTSL